MFLFMGLVILGAVFLIADAMTAVDIHLNGTAENPLE